MPTIDEVLNRRADLSTFVVHLTRDYQGSHAADNLESIITSTVIEARAAMGWAQTAHFGGPLPIEEVGRQPQRVVSFSETPLEHIYALFAEIPGRQVRLQPYGLAFTKMVARRRGANPVWYVDRTAGAPHQWLVPAALDALTRTALDQPDRDESERIGRLLPYFEVIGTWGERQKEFWWEREWRHVGNFEFTLPQVALWLCPEETHDRFGRLLREAWTAGGFPPATTPPCIDPNWGLERVIARLAHLGPDEVTPFAPRVDVVDEEPATRDAEQDLEWEEEDEERADPERCPYRVLFEGELCPACGAYH